MYEALSDWCMIQVVLSCGATADTEQLLALLNSPEHREAGIWTCCEPGIRTPVTRVVLASRQQAEAVTGYRIGSIVC